MNKMSIEDFDKQAEYCRENNTPEGEGCAGCIAENQICADNIMNIHGILNEREGIPVMEKVNASNITKIGYKNGNVYIGINNGPVYVYKDVPEEEYKKLRAAKSLGSYIRLHFRGVYSYKKVV
jgi:hypothetical protein